MRHSLNNIDVMTVHKRFIWGGYKELGARDDSDYTGQE
jgi:hypothetical protein